MSRVYNFSAGPAVLPEVVLRQAAAEMLDYQGTGMSVMEMSHRSKPFASIIETAEADLRELMAIPDNYNVLFLQGGATQQFAAIPMNLMQNKVADYIVSGSWSKKAFKEAKLYGDARCIASSEDGNFSYVPNLDNLEISPDADYVYICQNETIYGTTYPALPDTGDVPLVTDVSSMFLSEPMDVSKFGLIYGGVQKNIGPAGVVIVIVRDDLVREDVLPFTPSIMRYSNQVAAKSLSNTPPAYGIYICGLVFKWLKAQGGLAAMKEYLRHRHGGTRQELAVDYARVFLGAGNYDRITAPPYESVFTSEERILMQDARYGALCYYRRAGLDLPADNTTPEDHLGFELQFAAALCDRAKEAIAAGDGRALQEAVALGYSFFAFHQRNWLPQLCDAVDEWAQTDFYRQLAAVTRGYVDTEAAYFEAAASLLGLGEEPCEVKPAWASGEEVATAGSRAEGVQ